MRAGASDVIVAGKDDLVARVKAATDGRGADLVFDPIADDGIHEVAAAAASDGQLILYGFFHAPTIAGSFGTKAVPFPMTNFSLNMRWYATTDVLLDPRGARRLEQFVISGLSSRTLAPIIDRTFELAQIAEAHRYLESNRHVGKVVVTVR